MAITKAKKEEVNEEVKEELKPFLPINRDNLTFITANLWRYHHKGELKECTLDHAFKSVAAKDFSIRDGDVVICSNEKEAILVVVK